MYEVYMGMRAPAPQPGASERSSLVENIPFDHKDVPGQN
jgi:hypothetical protein